MQHIDKHHGAGETTQKMMISTNMCIQAAIMECMLKIHLFSYLISMLYKRLPKRWISTLEVDPPNSERHDEHLHRQCVLLEVTKCRNSDVFKQWAIVSKCTVIKKGMTTTKRKEYRGCNEGFSFLCAGIMVESIE